ncbi:hypothetical protein RJG79_10660 [Mycoplasmatota bacterium WC44]
MQKGVKIDFTDADLNVFNLANQLRDKITARMNFIKNKKLNLSIRNSIIPQNKDLSRTYLEEFVVDVHSYLFELHEYIRNVFKETAETIFLDNKVFDVEVDDFISNIIKEGKIVSFINYYLDKIYDKKNEVTDMKNEVKSSQYESTTSMISLNFDAILAVGLAEAGEKARFNNEKNKLLSEINELELTTLYNSLYELNELNLLEQVEFMILKSTITFASKLLSQINLTNFYKFSLSEEDEKIYNNMVNSSTDRFKLGCLSALINKNIMHFDTLFYAYVAFDDNEDFIQLFNKLKLNDLIMFNIKNINNHNLSNEYIKKAGFYESFIPIIFDSYIHINEIMDKFCLTSDDTELIEAYKVKNTFFENITINLFKIHVKYPPKTVVIGDTVISDFYIDETDEGYMIYIISNEINKLINQDINISVQKSNSNIEIKDDELPPVIFFDILDIHKRRVEFQEFMSIRSFI